MRSVYSSSGCTKDDQRHRNDAHSVDIVGDVAPKFVGAQLQPLGGRYVEREGTDGILRVLQHHLRTGSLRQRPGGLRRRTKPPDAHSDQSIYRESRAQRCAVVRVSGALHSVIHLPESLGLRQDPLPRGALCPGRQRVHQHAYVDQHSCRSLPGHHLSISSAHEDRGMPGHHREYLDCRAGGDLTIRAVHAAGGTVLLRGALAQRTLPQGLQLAHLDSAVRRAVHRHHLLLHIGVYQAEKSGARQTREQDEQARRGGSREETTHQPDADRDGRDIRHLLAATQHRQRRR